LYVRGGYTNTSYILRDNNDSESTSRGGFQIGGGAEVYVASNISLRLEYAYSQYGTANLLTNAGIDTEGYSTAGMLSRNAVLFGANYRF